ncbi:MAG: hypothetical protein ACNS62_08315 [Candidatus Cyclobacteriaceae bacterium M3_2C_046]
MKKIILSFIFGIFSNLLFGQDAEPKDISIRWSGFLKNDVFFDSRQTINAREGHFVLFPAPISRDLDGEDINAHATFNIVAINTRLTAKITGPDAFGAKTSGLVEGAFFGHSDRDMNEFRLRHAYAKLSWQKTELLFGQYWHPMFIPAAYPGTLSFNTGVPFQPFSRNPQVRLTRDLSNRFKLTAAAVTQVDFSSPGGSIQLRNSALPEFQMQLHYSGKGKNNNNLLAGIGGGFKTLSPRLSTDSLYKSDERVNSFSFLSYLKYTTQPITFKLEGTWGQNMYDLLMMGGYASIPSKDPVRLQKGLFEYATLDVLSFWTDIYTNHEHVQLGLFAGYSKNLGASKEVDTFFARADNMAFVYRISPRIVYISGKVKIGVEMERTSSAYALKNDQGNLDFDQFHMVRSWDEIANYRLLVSMGYFF